MAALLSEMEARIPPVADRFSRFTLYVGGGSPTLLPPAMLKKILEKAHKLVPGFEEVTVETNPLPVDGTLGKLLKGCGVTRVSLGVQSLETKVLKVLGRRAGREEALRAMETLSGKGFALSIDLIYGAPFQTREGMVRCLEEVTSFSPHHVSAYSLTLEKGVPLQRAVERGDYRLPEEEDWAGQFLAVKETLESAGYQHYETSNFARRGHYCIHNLIYWSNGSYLGLGLGAVSHIQGIRRGNTGNPGEYAGTHRPAWEESLPREKKAAETAILMLRTRWGIPENHWIANEPATRDRLKELASMGLLEVRGGRWTIPTPLLPVANEVLLRLLPD